LKLFFCKCRYICFLSVNKLKIKKKTFLLKFSYFNKEVLNISIQLFFFYNFNNLTENNDLAGSNNFSYLIVIQQFNRKDLKHFGIIMYLCYYFSFTVKFSKIFGLILSYLFIMKIFLHRFTVTFKFITIIFDKIS